MKDNKEFRDSVFEKAAAYEEKRKKKRTGCARRVLVLVVCALIAVPVLYIPINFVVDNVETPSETRATGATFPNSISGTEATFATEGKGTAETTVTETTGTMETTTAIGTTSTGATPSQGLEQIPDISFGDRIFYNGAFCYKTEFDESAKPLESEYYYYPYSFEEGELYEYAKGYFNMSESFFGHQSLIVAKITVERGVPVLKRIDTGEYGIDVSVMLVIEEGEEIDPKTWIMLIPVSKKVATPSPDRVKFYINQYHVD